MSETITSHVSVRINPSDFHKLSALQAKALMSGLGLVVAAARPIVGPAKATGEADSTSP